MRYILTLVLICLVSVSAVAQSPTSVLAPTGTLRAVFLGTNPIHARVDANTGAASGLVPDLVAELARKLGVPYKVVPSPDAAGVIDALKKGTADIGFLAYDESRAKEVDYGAAFGVMFSSYLVRANSSIQKSADVDRRGVTVAAVKGQTQELFVSSHLKNAQVRVLETMPPQTEVEKLLTSGEVNAFAINRQRALDAQSASNSKLRALSDSFLNVDQSFVVRRGDRAKLDVIEKFVSEVRDSGFIKSSIDRAKLAGVAVPGAAQSQRAPQADASLSARIQRLEDVEGIQTLLLDYGRYLDSRDLVSYSGLFARDGEWVGGFGSAKGPAAILEFMQKNLGTGPNRGNTFHILSNFMIDVKGDTATARSRWTFVTPSPDGKPVISQAGRYDDELVREDGRWKFKRRVASNDIPAAPK